VNDVTRRQVARLLLDALPFVCLMLAGVAVALSAPAAAADATDAEEAERRSITIWSAGIPLAGDLWLPAAKSSNAVPALLMVHGWGGVKRHLNESYAPHFVAAGYAVLTFDYRGWGESAGRWLHLGDDTPTEVRDVVDPLAFVEDIRNALAFLIGEPAVDADRVAIWGTSLGGGLALHTAAEFPQIKALLIQVGSVNPLAGVAGPAAERHPLAPGNLMRRRAGVARGELPPVPGDESTVSGLSGAVDWVQYGRFDPFSRKHDVRAATLIVDAAEEELFDIAQHGAALHAALKDRVPVRYEVLPGRHYDVYRGETYRQALSLQIDWLQRHVPASGP
jgi:uncharacterized protein